jgi:hypothetical protein
MPDDVAFSVPNVDQGVRPRPPGVGAGPTLCPQTSRSMMEVMSPLERNGDG